MGASFPEAPFVKLDIQQDYPAGLDRLWSVFAKPEYPEAKYRSLGATHFQMQRFDASETFIEIELERRAPVASDRIPDWARKFISAEQTVRQHTRWRRTRPGQVTAELNIVPVGLPVSVNGRGGIVERGPDQTRIQLQFEVDCRIPLVGGKIAKLFAEQIEQALAADHAFTLGYLKQAG